jgi:hypothetical protein
MNDRTDHFALCCSGAPALSGRPVRQSGRPLQEIPTRNVSPRKQPSLLFLLRSKEIPFMYIAATAAAAVSIAIL